MSGRRFLAASSVLITAAGLLLLGDQAYLRAKGWLAEWLIESAYAAHLRDGLPHRPWRWADLHPVARIEVPRLGLKRMVLSGAAGSSLAFGLGHISGTALPAEPGNCAVAGHRDTWALFLQDLRVGDEVRVTTRAGTQAYRVRDLAIVPREEVRVLEQDREARLTLITCYPFSGLLHSPWRYVVTCERDKGTGLEMRSTAFPNLSPYLPFEVPCSPWNTRASLRTRSCWTPTARRWSPPWRRRSGTRESPTSPGFNPSPHHV